MIIFARFFVFVAQVKTSHHHDQETQGDTPHGNFAGLLKPLKSKLVSYLFTDEITNRAVTRQLKYRINQIKIQVVNVLQFWSCGFVRFMDSSPPSGWHHVFVVI